MDIALKIATAVMAVWIGIGFIFNNELITRYSSIIFISLLLYRLVDKFLTLNIN